jgi:hypothetical protein
MNKQELINIIKTNFFSVNGKIKSNLKKYDYLNSELDQYVFARSLSEKVYLFLNNLKEPKRCKTCGNFLPFLSYKNPYKNYCSHLCIANSNEVKNKKEKTTFKNYGVKNPFQSTEIKLLLKNRKIGKESIEKRKKTNLSRYGVTNPAKNIEIKKRMKQTNLIKYGVDHPWKNKDIREKCKKTSLIKYGYDNPAKSSIVKEKTIKTNLIRYGQHPSTVLEIKNKIAYSKFVRSSTCYEKYVESLFSFEEFISRKSMYDSLKWKCKVCGTSFNCPICSGLIPRCPVCFPRLQGRSSVETDIVSFIKNIYIDKIKVNDRFTIKPKELDIYIPDKNLAIEVDGLYWHSELNGKMCNYHLEKSNLCNAKEIHLIHIFENEWRDKQEIIESIIKSNLGIYNTTLGARECIVDTVLNSKAEIFFNENHLQGYLPSSIYIGLYYNNDLVSCLSFSKPRFNKKYDWELTRFANKLNYKISGSFGKLWKHRPSGSIITYSDKRYFTGNVYKKFMVQLKDSVPSYYYFKSGKVYNRLNFQKHKLKNLLPIFDDNLTEWENMQINGYNRIWDCGNYVFEFK